MKSKIVFISLALFSAQASAEWKLVAETDTEKLYIDSSTIRKQANLTYVWTMTDYSLAQNSASGDKFKSDKTLVIYKCSEMQKAFKTLILYSDNLGRGEVIFSHQPEMYEVKYKDVVPGTFGEDMFKAACIKSKGN
jgi:hypothetical protein